MDGEQRSRNGFPGKPRPLGRGRENSWSSPTGNSRPSPPRSPLLPKSPVSSSSPWNSNSSTRGPRRGSFEDGVDAQPSSPRVVNGEYPELENKEIWLIFQEQVFVTHVESPVMFWAQTADHKTAQLIQKMSEDLQVYCRNKPLLQSTPFIGKVYGGVYSEDKKWYRCRVKELVGEDKVKVHFVDFGNTEEISLRSIVFLSRDILSLVPFAQLYCLDGVTTTNSELFDKGVEVLHNLTADKLLTVKLKETKKALDEPCLVELTDTSDDGVGNIANELVKQGLVTATFTEQDGPPPLSPRTSLSEAMIKEMEEMRKDNETLRSMVKVYQEKEKTFDEVQKFYSAQAAKDKENMKQAVNYKCLELVSKVCDLKKLRAAAPAHGKTTDVIREAILLTRNVRIDLKSLKSLQQVKETERKLEEAQQCLCDCKEKELMADLISQRDQGRQELFNTIDLFCKEFHMMPLEEREQSLQHSLGQLKEQKGALNCSSSDGVLERTVEAYEEWLERSCQDVAEVRQKVNQCTDALTTALANLQSVWSCLRNSSEAVDQHVAFGDLDALIAALSCAIQEEIDTSKVSEDKEAKHIVDGAITTLITEIEREVSDIKELRDHLVANYRNLQADMTPWLGSKPDIKKVGDVRRKIKSLRSRLRHRLADKKDLEEGDEAENPDELLKVESDISDIYLQLHQGFEEESQFLADLAKCASNHFPELPIAHPELGISEFLVSDGLLKPGRELEHYPRHDSVPYTSHDKCSVINTEFSGKPCILKEISLDRELGDKETLQNRAVNFRSVGNPCLVPLHAFFVKGNRAFVQMPLLTRGEEWLKSDECSSEDVAVVLRDVLEGLNALHTNDICHGGVHLQSVLVEKVDGQFRGRLDFYPFINTQCNKAREMKFFGDLMVKMNFPNKDHTTTFSQLTEDTDLLAVLGDLLDTDDVGRLTAKQTLQQAYFCKCL
ncbi:serine/threonine-protein kinase 31-like [Porites lutea]|uniref:serine/threonine-protein kinase 31-like n=1 Tax=Porites lutea TaxID=51062 RepID=UPI003CC5F773